MNDENTLYGSFERDVIRTSLQAIGGSAYSDTLNAIQDNFKVQNAFRILRNRILAGAVPDDVRELVIAARELLDTSDDYPHSPEKRKLDKAVEAFADRVPWDDEPEVPEAFTFWLGEDGEVIRAGPIAPLVGALSASHDTTEFWRIS